MSSARGVTGRSGMMTRREQEQQEEARRTSALMGFIVILLLAIAALMLVRSLTAVSKVEDCLLAGRHNCAPIEAPPGR